MSRGQPSPRTWQLLAGGCDRCLRYWEPAWPERSYLVAGPLWQEDRPIVDSSSGKVNVSQLLMAVMTCCLLWLCCWHSTRGLVGCVDVPVQVPWTVFLFEYLLLVAGVPLARHCLMSPAHNVSRLLWCVTGAEHAPAV